MALIITLILLSVTLVMIIALLAVAHRERASVGTSTDATKSRLASDTALQFAEAQIIANLRSTNAAQYSYGMLVSTNYVNWDFGYTPGNQNPTNVNYFYRNDGLPLNAADFLQNVANQQILPRAPVMVSATEPLGRYYLDLNRNGGYDTNGWVANLDENGNVLNPARLFQVGDPEWIGQLQNPFAPHAADNQFLSRFAYIVLPVGISLDLNYAHNENVGRALMLNSGSYNGVADTFMRNQGVGSWEINLAAFLADLNTNQWPTNSYNYNEPGGFPNTGSAFNDALALVSWRYNYNYNSLLSANAYFYNIANYPYNIDLYGDGPLQTTFNTNFGLTLPIGYDNINNPWPGADNTNKFYSQPADLFDPTKSYNGALVGFTNRLMNAGTTVAANGSQPTYDRYTFYRMLSQLGSDSLPADQGKLNLNYSNAVVSRDSFGRFTGVTIVAGAETNLVSWTPTNFFCTAADMLLKTYTTNWFQSNPSNYLAVYFGIVTNYYHPDGLGNIVTNDPTGFGLTNVPFYGLTNQIPAFGLGNIPVQINGNFVYSASVNRLLQLAANIYDASTNNFYPHVFRPVFLLTNQVISGNVVENLYIRDYQEITGVSGYADNQLVGPSGPYDVNFIFNTYPANSTVAGVNVYGLPWIIGAKKNLPSFNKFYSYNQLLTVRELQFIRQPQDVGLPYNSTRSADYTTNQMIAVGITNYTGFSFWNSYSNAYPNGAANYPYATPSISVFFNDFSRVMLSNGLANAYVNNQYQYITNLTSWPGSYWNMSVQPSSRTGSGSVYAGSFIGASTNMTILPTDALLFDNSGNFLGYEAQQFNVPITVVPNFPHIVVYATNYMQGFILDNGHVIDYVQLNGPNTSGDLAAQLQGPNSPEYVGGNLYYEMWSTNLTRNAISWGAQNQITVSETDQNVPNQEGNWVGPNNLPAGANVTPQNEANAFKGFFNSYWYDTGGNKHSNLDLTNQAPYTPIKLVTEPVEWTVNDPLVHSLSSDLTYPLSGLNANGVIVDDDITQIKGVPPSLTVLADRYQPWGVSGQLGGTAHPAPQYDANAYNFSYRDSLVYDSDFWDFPTNKFPTAGWLGRVHRGTPWQTVFLKSTNLLNDIQQSATGIYATGDNTWMLWTGDLNLFDAINLSPVEDRLLFDVFTAQPNDNASRGALSINQAGLAAWSALLSGMTVLTNNSGGIPSFNPNTFPLTQTNLTINPASVDYPDSPLYQVVTNINATRTLYPNGVFRHVGDVLSAPMLAEASPFINRTNASYNTGDRVDYDISDELYEWLPQQMMGLLRLDSQPRYVVYSFGQTIKPAPDSTILSGQYSGLVTNYQVMAESATRSVITVQPILTNTIVLVNDVPTTVPVTNYTIKVESFDVLPPQ